MSQFELLSGLLTGSSIYYANQRETLMAETASKDLKILLSKFKSERKANVITKSRRLGFSFSKILRGKLFNPNQATYAPGEIKLKFEPYKIKKFSLWKYATLIGYKNSRTSPTSSKTEITKVMSNDDVNNVNQILVKNSQEASTNQSDVTFCSDNGTENINKKRENSEEKKLSIELFFKSVIEGMKELDDEEVLELQIKILKALKITQAKRKFKQDFRKYCEATAF